MLKAWYCLYISFFKSYSIFRLITIIVCLIKYMKTPFNRANNTIRLPYFSKMLLVSVLVLSSVFMLKITASKASLTNSAGYNANRFAIMIKTEPTPSKIRYFQKYLFRYCRCFINWLGSLIEKTKIISKFAPHLKRRRN